MCNPALAVMAVTAAASIAQQKSAQKAQMAAQRRATEKENERLQRQQSAERVQEGFEAEQRAKELQAASKKVEAARASAAVAAAESGVSGNSVDLLLNDYERQGAALRFGLKRQQTQRGVVRNLAMGDMKLASENNMLRLNPPVKGIDYAGAISSGVSAGSAVGGAWNDYKAAKAGS